MSGWRLAERIGSARYRFAILPAIWPHGFGAVRFAPRPERLLLLAFLAFTLPLTVFLAIATPLGGVADEMGHSLRADSLASGQLLGRRAPVTLPSGATVMSAGFDVDLGFVMASEVGYPNMHFTAADRERSSKAYWTRARTFVQMTPLTAYFPIFYVPAAITIDVAKLAGLDPFQTFFAARLVNVAVFTIISLVALLTARRGQGLLFCVLSVPMTASLAGSLNPDGLLIASSVLVVALVTFAIDHVAENKLAPGAAVGGARVAAALVIALIGLAKFPFVILAALLLVPVQPLDRSFRRRVGVVVLAVLPGLVWVAYVMTHISVPWPPMDPYTPGPLWAGPGGVIFNSPVPARQFLVLLADPLRVVTVTWNTIARDPWIYKSAIGILGYLTLHLPDNLYMTWTVALVSTCAADMISERGNFALRGRATDALVAMIAIFVGIIAVYMSQYLTWTQVGAAVAFGPTGRYLLPLVPIAVLALPTIRAARLRGLRAALLAPACIAACVGLLEVPRAVISGFYIR